MQLILSGPSEAITMKAFTVAPEAPAQAPRAGGSEGARNGGPTEAVAFVGYYPCGAKSVGDKLVPFTGYTTDIIVYDGNKKVGNIYVEKRLNARQIIKLLEERYGGKWTVVERSRSTPNVPCAWQGTKYVLRRE